MEPLHTMLNELEATSISLVVKARCIRVFATTVVGDKTIVISKQCVLQDRTVRYFVGRRMFICKVIVNHKFWTFPTGR